MKMRADATRVSGTELLKDVLFPPVCPVCGDIIPADRRAAMHAESYGSAVSGAVPPVHRDGSSVLPGIAVHGGAANGTMAGHAAEIETVLKGRICDSCRNSLEYITPPFCKKCGRQLSSGKGEETRGGLCRTCSQRQRQFISCRCLTVYEGAAQEIMTDLKFNSKKDYAGALAALAAERLGSWLDVIGAQLLIPVPVHDKRLRKRGYNQAELIADGIGRLTGVSVRSDILVRSRNTAAQKDLHADERLRNLQNAFTFSQRLHGSPTVVIVDDIYTTGSTMEACTEKLQEAGAGRIYGLCICAGTDAG